MTADLFQPQTTVAASHKLERQHARAAEKERQAAVTDLTAMRDQYRQLIDAGGYRPEHQLQLQLWRRRRAALDYAIDIVQDQKNARSSHKPDLSGITEGASD